MRGSDSLRTSLASIVPTAGHRRTNRSTGYVRSTYNMLFCVSGCENVNARVAVSFTLEAETMPISR
jgi:uncharacterized protein Veg